MTTGIREHAQTVVERIQRAGFTAYWAGGCVRDMLLGGVPKDYDVATGATPDQVQALFPGSVAVGKSFGVVRVPVGDVWFEVATFRRDLSYSDGRRPDGVAFTDPRTDAQRRDFTVNAVFYDPVTRAFHDFVGGRSDLAAKVIRCVGEPRDRFREDRLRMLRAVRFASVLSFSIDPATADAIRDLAPLILGISPERIGEELARMLTEAPRPGDAVERLDAVGLLEPILPEVTALRGQEQPAEFHPEGDVFRHTMDMLNLMREPSRTLAFAVLLHDVGKPATARPADDRLRFDGHAALGADMARAVMRRLRFSNEEIEAVCRSIHDHMRFIDVKHMRMGTLRRMIGSPAYPLDIELHRLDCLASHGKMDNYEFLRKIEAEIRNEPVLPPAWVSGRDVLAMGVPQGPEVGRWLRLAYDAQLNGEAASKEELLGRIRVSIRCKTAMS